MNILAILLDGPLNPEWQLFQWCIYFPALTVAISWILIRRKKNLAVLALCVAVLSAGAILNQLYANIQIREHSKRRLEAIIRITEADASKAEPKQRAQLEELLREGRRELQFFNSQMVHEIPPIDRQMILAVWFGALFPFVLIIAFYLSAANPGIAQKSLPTSDSSSP